MRTFSPKVIIGIFLPLLLVVGIAGSYLIGQNTLSANTQASAVGAEVSVTVVIPENETLAGTAVIILEDITFQDVPSVEIARLEVPVASLIENNGEVAVPVDLQAVDSKATINVAVLIDVDDSGEISDGDWISNALAPVITNSLMKVSVDIVQVGIQ